MGQQDKDGLRIAAELDAAGEIVSRFNYVGGSHSPDTMTTGGETYRFVKDQVGSPRLVVNVADGSVAQRLDYDAFGVVTLDTNPGFQPFGFAGGLYDADTGLVRFGARDYDAATGRWTAKDPIRWEGDQENFYVYVDGDPVNRKDPNGLDYSNGIQRGRVYGHAPQAWVGDGPGEVLRSGTGAPTPGDTDVDFVKVNGEWHKIAGPVRIDSDGDIWGISLEPDDGDYDWTTRDFPDQAMCGAN